MRCRFCNNQLVHEFIDLTNSPPSNSYLKREKLNEAEIFLPLKLLVCEKCWLVQIDEYKTADEIFDSEYAYFSSYSKSWLAHAQSYVEMITTRLELCTSSRVVEVASNDGYLLQFFQKKNISCLGIEPTESTANVAVQKGIPVIQEFFGTRLARQLIKNGEMADLLLGNNVLAHVPDINDFVKGLKMVLKPEGTITMEFPHLLNLVNLKQFDTIYHEHFSYFSLHTVSDIFSVHGLEIVDVETLDTHGGSLRIYARHQGEIPLSTPDNVASILMREKEEGMLDLNFYKSFQKKVNRLKNEILLFLIKQKQNGKRIVAYGAAAKGNTLLNYCGIKKDLIDFVVDASPHKQGKFLPGSHIPIVSEANIKNERPDIIFILPWNIKDEVVKQLSYVKNWGGIFVTAIPDINIVN